MKNNTAASKALILQALASLPQDETVAEVRGQLKRAVERIEHVEAKRAKRAADETPERSWQDMIKSGALKMAEGINSPSIRTDVSAKIAARALGNIEKMIKTEQDKLEALNKKHTKTPTSKTGDDDDFRAIHG